jgi:predicted ester cyclase
VHGHSDSASAFASHQFRAAVPDLAVRVEKMIVAGDYVTVHMKFTGHFTGKLGRTPGKGQQIEFIGRLIARERWRCSSVRSSWAASRRLHALCA